MRKRHRVKESRSSHSPSKGVLDVAQIVCVLDSRPEGKFWNASVPIEGQGLLELVPNEYLGRVGARRLLMRHARRLGYTWYHSAKREIKPLHLALVGAAFGLDLPLVAHTLKWWCRTPYSFVGPIQYFLGYDERVKFFCDGVSAGFELTPSDCASVPRYQMRSCAFALPTSRMHECAYFHITLFDPSLPEESARLERALFLLREDERFPFSLDTEGQRLPSHVQYLNAHQKLEAWKRYSERTAEICANNAMP
jgi:hypothetical protein